MSASSESGAPPGGELEQLIAQLRAAEEDDDASAHADASIPLLTEIIDLPRYDAGELPPALTDIDWSQLALRVQENVLERLLGDSQTLIDEPMHDALHALIERASASLAAELHLALAPLLRERVARAVTDELTRVHDEISRAHPSAD